MHIELLKSVSQAQIECDRPEQVVDLCLGSMEIAIGWHSPHRSDCHLLGAQEKPFATMLDPAVLEWLFALYETLRSHPTLAVKSRKLVTQLASVPSSDFADDVARNNFVVLTLTGTARWYHRDTAEALDACELFVRLCNQFEPQILLGSEMCLQMLHDVVTHSHCLTA